MERKEYELSAEDLQKILAASQPTPVMYLTGGVPMYDSSQENANRAWEEVGRAMGFDPMTVMPVSGRGRTFFSAVPVERKAP